jgi:hypothetical protein
MDKCSDGVGADDSEHPGDQQDHGECVQHLNPPQGCASKSSA